MNTKPIYYAIVRHESKDWRGTVPEEIGHEYQSLCQYQRHNPYSCSGGFRLDADHTLTHYTEEQLQGDYDRDSDHSSMAQTNDYSYEQESRDRDRDAEAT